MKNKKEFIILIVIIIALGVIYGMQQSVKRPGADNLPQPAKFAAEDVARIVITTPAETLTLVRTDDQWRLTPEGAEAGYPVEERLSAMMPEMLANFKLTAVISESNADYARYQLDDAAKIAVKAFDANGKTLLDFDLGSAVANNFKHSYVKITGDPKVYHGRGNLRAFFDTDEFQLREKNIIKFDSDAIASIALDTYADEGRTLIQSQEVKDADGNEIKIWLGPQNTYVDSGEVESFMNFVKSVFVYEFLPADTEISGEPEWGLIFFDADGRESEVLKVYHGTPSPDGEEFGQTHMVTSNTVGSPFLLTMAQQSDIFKRFSELLTPRATDGTPSDQLHVENLPEDAAEQAQPLDADNSTNVEEDPENAGPTASSDAIMPVSDENGEAQNEIMPDTTE